MNIFLYFYLKKKDKKKRIKIKTCLAPKSESRSDLSNRQATLLFLNFILKIRIKLRGAP